ncbi:hypothetical protein C2G38_2155892 [Gigaspora rosea]|uniref:Uncharacterized protein n=1 Tax=Gigaspora rosea TaxID=44941 RepID=A0A397W3B5_9GLOM|nr:hypothetical protein C2G38_2155892 [Gigaspora rosea]
MKVNGIDKILGDYNPIGWDRNNPGYKNDYGPLFGDAVDLAISNSFNLIENIGMHETHMKNKLEMHLHLKTIEGHGFQ